MLLLCQKAVPRKEASRVFAKFMVKLGIFLNFFVVLAGKFVSIEHALIYKSSSCQEN